MDVKDHVEVLRKHGEYVGTLVTQLTDKLTQLAQGLSAPQRPPAAQTAGLCAECDQLASALGAETDFLRRRVHFFVEDIATGYDSPDPHDHISLPFAL